MRWERFINQVRDLPVIEVKSFIKNDPSIRVQISRWVAHKKIIKARRGVYVLQEPYRRVDVYEPYLAAILKKPSYLSLEKALEYHNLIPEGVPVFTSVTTKRQARFVSGMGVFDYKHIMPFLFWGYNSVSMSGQTGFIASPEKALLDYLYLRRPKVSWEFLEELRLQNTSKIIIKKLLRYARDFKRKDMLLGAELLVKYIKRMKNKT